ncbi:hypothetical protein DM860_006258 [Cuscuta australis]|uniref:Ubiquitin carboxyl-terminal hydrolase 7 ICP0-binding domain-containing protein n=1 Tax=Cuscuta australis TaxID=267555 RepID=A0A328DKK2_9ASTE|nr:hypothetical protein DM860_006258 [Cuscuta australis]
MWGIILGHSSQCPLLGKELLIIKVVRDEDLRDQIGKDICFDLIDHAKKEVAEEFDIPEQFQRFWTWAWRKNQTYRPLRPLTQQAELTTVGELSKIASKKAGTQELNLFLEVNYGPERCPIPPPVKDKEDLLLFFKLYDPEKEELRYVGWLFVKSHGKPIDILTKMNKMAGFAPHQEIELFEEITSEPSVMCLPLDKSVSFHVSEIGDGDIICFQKYPTLDIEPCTRYPDVPSFMEYVKKVNGNLHYLYLMNIL